MVETSAACDLLHTSSVAISDLARSTIRLAVELCGPRIWRPAYCPVVRSFASDRGAITYTLFAEAPTHSGERLDRSPS